MFFIINATDLVSKEEAGLAEAGWSLLQLLIAIAYVVCITIAGMRVNEGVTIDSRYLSTFFLPLQARLVLQPALKFTTDSEESRFDVTRVRFRAETTSHMPIYTLQLCFRVKTQHPQWGLTIWGALEVERGLLLTVSAFLCTKL